MKAGMRPVFGLNVHCDISFSCTQLTTAFKYPREYHVSLCASNSSLLVLRNICVC